MSHTKKPLSWIIWHPHQGLWNWMLIDRLQKMIPFSFLKRVAKEVVINLDNFILWLKAIDMRITALGIFSVFCKTRVPDNVAVIYLDAGTHIDGAELNMVVNQILPPLSNNFSAYGFEASRDAFVQVSGKFDSQPNVQLVNRALVHQLPENGKLKLFKKLTDGCGDSIYGHSETYEEVSGMRLSDFMNENDLANGDKIMLLRMNIEGAEFDVIQNLVENNLHHRIDGYFGMWDDVSKIDIALDKRFRAYLANHNIKPFTFNGRDMSQPLRQKCITYHMKTCIMLGLQRLRKEQEAINQSEKYGAFCGQ